jgi:hypothetical protein
MAPRAMELADGSQMNDFEMRQMVGVPSMQLPASIEIDGGRTKPRFGWLEYGFVGVGEP